MSVDTERPVVSFELTQQPIAPTDNASQLTDAVAGALVTFEGWVRNHNDGRPVGTLEYDAYPSMAVSEGTRLLEEACRRFALRGARAVHRTGPVPVGELAVWVGVTAEHRQEAFLACRWVMDAIKRDVPIWKREAYLDGAAPAWVNAGANTRSEPDDPASDPRYARQLPLRRLGPDGQRRLAGASVLVIGVGGLGCPVVSYLAAAGVGRLTLVDGDRVDVTNLHRQVLYSAADVGRGKAEVAAERARELNPRCAAQAVTDAASAENLPALLHGHDVVVDCTDNFDSKYAIHDACWNAGVPLVQAAVYQFDGWVQVISPLAGAGCHRCGWPEPPPDGCVGSCAEAGVLGVAAGALGVLQATQVLAVLLDWPEAATRHTIHFDVLSAESRRLRREPRSDCECQSGLLRSTGPDWVLRPGERANVLRSRATVLDLREPAERNGAPPKVQALANVPEAEWESLLARFTARPLILACASGRRARRCVDALGRPDGVYAWSGSIAELLC